jgi:hypothetical protein
VRRAPERVRSVALVQEIVLRVVIIRGIVGEYNATTGAAINASLITGLELPDGLAVSGNTLLRVPPGSKLCFGHNQPVPIS